MQVSPTFSLNYNRSLAVSFNKPFTSLERSNILANQIFDYQLACLPGHQRGLKLGLIAFWKYIWRHLQVFQEGGLFLVFAFLLSSKHTQLNVEIEGA